MAMAAVILTLVSVWFLYKPVMPQQATWEDVMNEARTGGYKIITTRELANRYSEDGSDLLLIDTRQAWEYRSAHIKGAVNFPMEPTWWARWRKANELEKILGPHKQRDIVFY